MAPASTGTAVIGSVGLARGQKSWVERYPLTIPARIPTNSLPELQVKPQPANKGLHEKDDARPDRRNPTPRRAALVRPATVVRESGHDATEAG